MDTPIGANIGQELTALQLEQTERPPIQLPEATPAQVPVAPVVDEMHFCTVMTLGIEAGKSSRVIPPERPKKGEKDNWVNPRGWLVVGPSSTMLESSYSAFLANLQGFRWWLNPGKLYHAKGGKLVWQNPSIVENHVEECACSKHGCTWRDVKTFQEVCLMREAKQGCPVCGSRIETQRLFTSILPGRPNQKALFQSAEDELLQRMHIAMCETAPAASTILPRIWAVYPTAETPFDWAPTDPAAKDLDAKFKVYGKSLRPFKQARLINFAKAQNHRISKWCLESKAGLQFGWVRTTDLCGQTIDGPTGYTRNFGFEPQLTEL